MSFLEKKENEYILNSNSCNKIVEAYKNCDRTYNALFAFWLILVIISNLKLTIAICCCTFFDEIFVISSIIQLPFKIVEWSLTLSMMIKIKNINNKEECGQIISEYIKSTIKCLINVLIIISCNLLLPIIFLLILFYNEVKQCFKCIFEKICKIEKVNFAPSITIIPFQQTTDIIPPKLLEIIETLKEKIEDFLKTFIVEENEVKENMKKFLSERHSKLEKFLKDYKDDDPKSKETFGEELENQQKLETFIKDLNKEEYEIELEILMNIVNKMHYIFNLGVDTIKICKEIITDTLKEKTASLPELAAKKIESQIKEISEYTPIKFLDSKFGKPLKEALEKYGLSELFLNSFKKDLLNERKVRREKERKEFSIEKNEFEDEENNLELSLFKLIMEEYSNEDFQNVLKQEISKNLIKSK